MTPFTLAWSNLRQQRVRTLISLVGVAFAVLLIFMQLGFLDSVRRTATQLYEKLDFDLLLVSQEYGNLARPASFSRRRLAQARAAPGVERVMPLTVVLGLWREPSQPSNPRPKARYQRSILILAVDPSTLGDLFRRPVPDVFPTRARLRDDADQLARLGTVLMDRMSNKDYGTPTQWNRERINELNGRQVEIVGDIKIGTGFAYSGLLVTGEATLSRLLHWPEDRVSFGLVKLAPNADPKAALAAMRELTQSKDYGDVKVYTRDQINEKEKAFWLSGTAVGQFFTAGVIIALLVGGVFVYQMMAADISRRLPEFATIRALGYPRGYLSRVVYWQGFLLAGLGYVFGFIASLLGYLVTHHFASVPIEMTFPRAVNVLGMTVAMCMGSALIAVRAAHNANPADLF